MAIRYLSGFVILLLTMNASAFATRYKGVGGQIEAYGTITTAFVSGIKAAEICEKYPSLKLESEESTKIYLTANKNIYDRVGRRLLELADMNGGEAERRRLLAEIDAALPGLSEGITQEVRKLAPSERACSQLLSNLRKGLWDLNIRHAQEIELIMGLAGQPYLKGMIVGCVDEQRKKHTDQGLKFDAKLVNEYCHCKAANLATLLPDSESLRKLWAKDPKIVEVVRNVSEYCIDAARNGKRFSP